jgi:hypothetical protein
MENGKLFSFIGSFISHGYCHRNLLYVNGKGNAPVK